MQIKGTVLLLLLTFFSLLASTISYSSTQKNTSTSSILPELLALYTFRRVWTLGLRCCRCSLYCSLGGKAGASMALSRGLCSHPRTNGLTSQWPDLRIFIQIQDWLLGATLGENDLVDSDYDFSWNYWCLKIFWINLSHMRLNIRFLL